MKYLTLNLSILFLTLFSQPLAAQVDSAYITEELRFANNLSDSIEKEWKRIIHSHTGAPLLSQGELKAVINFTVNKDGTISNIYTTKSSNNNTFDQYCIGALRNQPNNGPQKNELHFDFHFKLFTNPNDPEKKLMFKLN